MPSWAGLGHMCLLKQILPRRIGTAHLGWLNQVPSSWDWEENDLYEHMTLRNNKILVGQ